MRGVLKQMMSQNPRFPAAPVSKDLINPTPINYPRPFSVAGSGQRGLASLK